MVAAVHDLKCEGVLGAIDYHGCVAGKKSGSSTQRCQTIVGYVWLVMRAHAVLCRHLPLDIFKRRP